MRSIALLVPIAACATTTTRVDNDYTREIRRDTLVYVVERATVSYRENWGSTDDRYEDYRVDRAAYGAAEIDLDTGTCEWRSGQRRSRAADVRVPGERAAGIAFPLGALVAIAPGKAVFASPLGTVVFTDDRHDVPLAGVQPPVATGAWWNPRAPLAGGRPVAVAGDYTVRVAERDGRRVLEADRGDVHRRYELAADAEVVSFADTGLVATGDALVDVVNDKTLRDVAVNELLAFADGVYILLRDGRVLHTALAFDISTAEPLAVRFELVAVRGRRLVFDDSRALYVHDPGANTWRWREYGDCFPADVRR